MMDDTGKLLWVENISAAEQPTFHAHVTFLLSVSQVGDAWVWGVFAPVAMGGARLSPPPDACRAATRDDAQRVAREWANAHIVVRTDGAR